MAVVGFLILFSGVINGYFAAGGTAAVLVFVLSVTVPAPVSAIGLAAGRLGPGRGGRRPGRDADLAAAGARHAAGRHGPGLPGAGHRGRFPVRGRARRGRQPGRGGEVHQRPARPADRHPAPADRADQVDGGPGRADRRAGLAAPVAGDHGPVARRRAVRGREHRRDPRGRHRAPGLRRRTGRAAGAVRPRPDRPAARAAAGTRPGDSRPDAGPAASRNSRTSRTSRRCRPRWTVGSGCTRSPTPRRQIAGYARAASPRPDGPPIEGVPAPAELGAAAMPRVPPPPRR